MTEAAAHQTRLHLSFGSAAAHLAEVGYRQDPTLRGVGIAGLSLYLSLLFVAVWRTAILFYSGDFLPISSKKIFHVLIVVSFFFKCNSEIFPLDAVLCVCPPRIVLFS
jgi:hypothetical protein